MISIVGIGLGNLVEELTIKAYNTLKKSDSGIYPGNFIGEELKVLFEGKAMIIGRDIRTLISIIIGTCRPLQPL